MKSRRHTRCMAILFVLVFFSLIVNNPSIAQDHALVLTQFVPAFGGSCQSGYPNVLAGSVFTLHLRNTADKSLRRLSPGWPEGYTLEAALDLPSGQSFAPTPGLIDRLTPTPFFTFDNLYQERKLLLGDSVHVYESHLNVKNFAIHIPSDLAGHTVAIRALYHHGDMNLQTKPDWDEPVSIIAPCDRADTAEAVTKETHGQERDLPHCQSDRCQHAGRLPDHGGREGGER